MSEKRFTLDDEENGLCRCILVDGEEIPTCEICDLLNKLYEENEKFRFLIDINSVSERKKLERQVDEQQSTITKLNDEKVYWKNKAMTLLMQVRRLTSRMTDKEVKEFSKELEE